MIGIFGFRFHVSDEKDNDVNVSDFMRSYFYDSTD